MEPKNPIIIDGVDVSGCEYCLKMTRYRCTIQRDIHKCLCEENPNCYYKQLKHKEQECKALREEKAYTDMAYEYFKEQRDRYLQTLIEIIRFIKEDKKFARYSGRPVIFVRSALEKIEKILEENDIKISDVLDE